MYKQCIINTAAVSSQSLYCTSDYYPFGAITHYTVLNHRVSLSLVFSKRTIYCTVSDDVQKDFVGHINSKKLSLSSDGGSAEMISRDYRAMIWTVLFVIAELDTREVMHKPRALNDGCDKLSRREPKPVSLIIMCVCRVGGQEYDMLETIMPRLCDTAMPPDSAATRP
jgi:hypothetical protein